jgi:hypothetical protein
LRLYVCEMYIHVLNIHVSPYVYLSMIYDDPYYDEDCVLIEKEILLTVCINTNKHKHAIFTYARI